MKAEYSFKYGLLGGILIVFFLSGQLNSQTPIVAVTAGTPAPNHVLLEASSTSKGALLPRMNQAQANYLATTGGATEGTMIYRTGSGEGYYYHDGTSFVPFSYNTNGAIEMVVGASNVLYGEGFNVNHFGIGLDEVSFNAPYSSAPFVLVTGSTLTGQPPVFPNDFCTGNFVGCVDNHINSVRIQFPPNANSNVAIAFNNSVSGFTGCDNAINKNVNYSFSDPAWLTNVTFNPGQTFRVYTSKSLPGGVNNAISAWVDWDQSGTFELSEQVQQESANGLPNAQFNVLVPATACPGRTQLRVMTRDIFDHQSSCDVGDNQVGESENIEINIGGSNVCTFPEQQTVCNVGATTFNKFNVQCTDLTGKLINTLYHFKVIETH